MCILQLVVALWVVVVHLIRAGLAMVVVVV
jgi:hypothetical protein